MALELFQERSPVVPQSSPPVPESPSPRVPESPSPRFRYPRGSRPRDPLLFGTQGHLARVNRQNISGGFPFMTIRSIFSLLISLFLAASVVLAQQNAPAPPAPPVPGEPFDRSFSLF